MVICGSEVMCARWRTCDKEFHVLHVFYEVKTRIEGYSFKITEHPIFIFLY
jgi:hypothetical protein